MEPQNNIKGKVTPVDFSLESYTVYNIEVDVPIRDIVKENGLPGK